MIPTVFLLAILVLALAASPVGNVVLGVGLVLFLAFHGRRSVRRAARREEENHGGRHDR